MHFHKCLAIAFVIVPTHADKAKWVARYDGPAHGADRVTAIAIDGASNVYVTGYSTGSGTGTDYCTIKYDREGNQLWAQRYDGPGSGTDQANAIVVDGSGNAYVTGYSYGGAATGNDICTIKYDTDGNQLWVQRFDGSGHLDDSATGLFLNSSGNVYVVGSYGVSSTNSSACTIEYDSDGNLLGVLPCGGKLIAFDADGDILITSNIVGSGSGSIHDRYNIVTYKYDADGNLVWGAQYDGPAHMQDVPVGIAVDADGNVIVAGYSYNASSGGGSTDCDYCTLKYDTSGNLMWVQRYDGPAHSADTPYGLAVDGDGSVYVTGSSTGTVGGRDFCTVKYDASGNLMWVQRYDGPAHSSDYATAIALDSSGNAYVTGDSMGIEGGEDFCTIKYDNGGNVLWIDRYDGSFHSTDRPSVIAVDGTGRAYAAGYSVSTAGGEDFLALMCYGPSGTLSGHVALDDFKGGSSDGPVTGTLEYRWPRTNEVAYSCDIIRDLYGNFSNVGVPLGTYDVVCKCAYWLGSLTPDVAIVDGAWVNSTLSSGDTWPDDRVDLLDLAAVLANFDGVRPVYGQPGDANWDGAVDTLDLSIVLSNFGLRGD